ncbi:hypothetical protein [Streptomyces tailanensis]|uniref:hypothetical protein n=1 Tax=Streptomyces tailanensis TaxID=2569858 RepID=UPI00122DD248|nr:hypothetical protein [Streptomyces tailanensis]
MSIRRRVAAGALTGAVLAGGVAFTTTPAAAAGCKTYSKTYYLSEAKVSTRIGQITTRVQICENSKGKITSSRAWSENSTTAPAKLLGWNLDYNKPYQSSKSSKIVKWAATGRAQTCLAGKIPVCSYAEDFKVTATYYSSRFVGPTPVPRGKVNFKPACTNKHCKLKFNKNK